MSNIKIFKKTTGIPAHPSVLFECPSPLKVKPGHFRWAPRAPPSHAPKSPAAERAPRKKAGRRWEAAGRGGGADAAAFLAAAASLRWLRAPRAEEEKSARDTRWWGGARPGGARASEADRIYRARAGLALRTVHLECSLQVKRTSRSQTRLRPTRALR